MKHEDAGKVQERRRHQRKPLETKIKYTILMPYCAVGSTKDISEGGLCLTVDKELNKGFILRLEMETSEGKVNQLVKVMWQQKAGDKFLTGVKFLT
jgi:riboflavin synthase alpha subunit